MAADVKKGGNAAGKREITFSFIYKQHRWLKRTLCNFGVKRSLTGISNLYAGYERGPHCLLVLLKLLFGSLSRYSLSTERLWDTSRLNFSHWRVL